MGRVLENHGKQLLRQAGIPTPRFEVVASAEGARAAASALGTPVVLKALVPVGKRARAGAVRFAETPDEAASEAAELLAMAVSAFPVQEVLIEEKLDISQEWYVSVAIDTSRRAFVVVASTAGGVDVEGFNRQDPKTLHARPVDPMLGLHAYEARQIWSALGVTGELLNAATSLLVRLYRLFDDCDAYLLEVNPLALTSDGKMVAADCVMRIDDAALYRHPELQTVVQSGSERAWRPLTELERQILAVNEADPYRGTARYTEMEGGEIGFLCGGGGGSLLCFDTLVSLGMRPANYTEIGGNPPEEKVYGLARGVLSKPGVKGLFVAHNITNNTQVDVLARGIIRALRDLGIDPESFPVVVREAGVNDSVARGLFLEAGIEYYGDDLTMVQAAERMVLRMKGAHGL